MSIVCADPACASELDVVISELHYNPASGSNSDEFLEIYNSGPLEVDLADWQLTDGVFLTFPPGLVLPARSFLVVSPNATYTVTRYGISNVFGDYAGSLSNGGEIVSLVNAEGDTISRFRYDDNDPWPESPDGLGPSLELRDSAMRTDVGGHWRASTVIDGTPGRANSVFETRDSSGPVATSIVSQGAEWRYFKGEQPFPSNWNEISFNDSDWLIGPTGIGYGDDDDNTVLDDMEGGYLSFAVRRVFSVTQEQIDSFDSVTFRLTFDDAYVAFLNGSEIGRSGFDSDPGTEVAHDERGSPDAPIEPTEINIFLSPSLLSAGDNVLAIQIHNEDLDSSDTSCIPSVIGNPVLPTLEINNGSPLTINEVKPTEAGSPGFIELYNASSEEISLGDYQIVDHLGNRFTIASSATLDSGNWLTFDDAVLGFDVFLAGSTYMLVEGDGQTWVHGVNPRVGMPGENGFSFGQVPDGNDRGHVCRIPTPDGANTVTLEQDVVISEIFFHPAYVAPEGECLSDCSDLDQWIEIHNRSGAAIGLSGWQLTSATDFLFPENTSIAAGGSMVVTRSRDRFLTTYPGVDANLVLGDWTRALSHGSDRIRLRDELGNIVQQVTYGDGKPLNDEEPDDEMDDGTFLASNWPTGSDGTGSTIELAHPDLDPSLGGSWRDGPLGGTPAATNQALDNNAPPVVGDVHHFPAVPSSNESVRVECRVSSTSALTSVALVWRLDGSGSVTVDPMNDGGTQGDLVAGDGIYSATIPSTSNNTIVAFEIQATNADDSTRVPPVPAVPPHENLDGPYYLYQTLDQGPLDDPSVNYMIVMTAADQAELENRSVFSDVLLPATFIARDLGDDGVYHTVGIRYRGSQTRTNDRKSYRIEFPAERPFIGIEDLNLQASQIDSEILSADLMHRAGLPTPQEWTVNLVFQGQLDRLYVRKEHLDDEFLSRFYGDRAADGNLYRAIDPDDNENFPFQGNLSYLGSDPEAYRPYYCKRTNEDVDDFSDIVELTRVFDRTETPDDEAFADQLEQLIDVDQWMLWFAAHTCAANTDGSIHTRSGEDYFLYKVPENSGRPDSGRWVLTPWDIEESFSAVNQPVVPTQVVSPRRFLTHPRFAPRFYCALQKLRTGAFSRIQMRYSYELIRFLFDFNTIDGNDAFVASRLGVLDVNVPSMLSAGATSAEPDGTLIPGNATWKYFPGTEEPAGGTDAWADLIFDDTSWEEGSAGFGYGDGDDATVLPDMENGYTTVYIRKVFDVPDPADIPGMELRIDYDDGFVAYLNGVIVAQRGVNGDGPFPATAISETGHEAGAPSQIDISEFVGLLNSGDNILAVQGLNRSLDSTDFSLHPSLGIVTEVTADAFGCGDLLYATSGTVFLGGRAAPCVTRSVTIDDQPAVYDPFSASWTGSVSVSPGDNVVTVKAFDEFNIRVDTLEVLIRRIQSTPTEINGTLGGDTTWTAANNPHLMTGDVTVPAGATLTIEPGTEIFGSPDASILVSGRIVAQGTEQDPIRFMAAECDSTWGGIGMQDTGDTLHVIEHCNFDRGSEAPGFVGCVSPVNADLRIENSNFTIIRSNAVEGTDGTVEVRGCTFSEVEEGVHCTNCDVIVQNCFFHRLLGDKDAIDFDFNGDGRSLIEGCIFMDGTDDGVDLGDTSVDIRNNIFIRIADKALSLEGNGPNGPPTFSGNIMFAGGTAVALKDGVNVVEGHNNTIVGNSEGIDLFAKDSSPDGGHALLHSNIVWNNVIDVRLDGLSTLELTESNILQGWTGSNNISLDPQFTDLSDLDFSLAAGSPCIGTGRDGVDMGAVTFDGSAFLFIRGDVDATGNLDINDAVLSLRIIFQAMTPPDCVDRVDTNDDGALDVVDPMRTLFFLFAGGQAPSAPYPGVGTDPTGDTLPCPEP